MTRKQVGNAVSPLKAKYIGEQALLRMKGN